VTRGTRLPPPTYDQESHCITCGDEAVPLRVVKIDARRELALCENDDRQRTTVEIALVQPVALQDVLLVHAGTAIAHAAPEETTA
jgi:hydrogenase maturation factor